jgi:WD40 repeat protein
LIHLFFIFAIEILYFLIKLVHDHTQSLAQNSMRLAFVRRRIYLYDTLRSVTMEQPVETYGGDGSWMSHRCGASYNMNVAFSPDAGRLIAGSSSGSVHVWSVNVRNGPTQSDAPVVQPVQRLGPAYREQASGVAWCWADPTKVASCGDTVRVFDYQGAET